MLSEMMCAMRRQLSGAVKYCLRRELVAAEHVPQPEFGAQPAVALRVSGR